MSSLNFFQALQNPSDSDSSKSVELIKENSPSTPNLSLTTPVASPMNVSPLQIPQDVPVSEASKGIPSITISSTPYPTNTQASIGQSSYLRNVLLNPSGQSQSNAQIPRETMRLNKQPMLKMDLVSGAHERKIQKHGYSEKRNISNVGKDSRIITGMSSFDK
ncbi:hypothetical protein O181_000102 [Austropuccinia psidii MF-1]|uniref:Uncharacterized protein n=1 Tax=Austropuccinia psidii MF-1 TaxID=1389203 RepID=A0A9Q3B827_9BASI|nr:hypothetical protein [Austropuccinia psidii MF-1]